MLCHLLATRGRECIGKGQILWLAGFRSPKPSSVPPPRRLKLTEIPPAVRKERPLPEPWKHQKKELVVYE